MPQVASTTVSLRPMTKTDLDVVRQWRNAPETREKMFTTHEIKPDEHAVWFERVQRDNTKRFYVVNLEGKDIGMVSFTDINQDSGRAEWGFYKAPNAPAGIGLVMLHAALNHAFDTLGLKQVDSRVLAINPKVLHLHNKLGFTQLGEAIAYDSDENAIPYVDFALTIDAWHSREPNIKEQRQSSSQQSKTL
ncbi:UDP-4-amino-4,6-dideoxy-N-acetyl-beta-L-altrosamine N-acetyltransferase [Enterovibrio norvegicus]|uniref:UDP-4-amino-4, 6-dideoxy-N-acetyl-beta-L-altrosamine N-acetyltransferase n=1 Tax=Enterovibrio norvegicus TaxID=188144 RepID=A0ABV4KX14_9GAMM|nr:UDP-4-amino-4,6-dideoxy-N-acetyl-beta-L-altrosamine N-acetyltransferase [Enterovibrio norvegicus]OEF58674.1 UDP-4-amino-4,6-dideoxy-N-acetyl-beta-L-altrosamine N-acetyltransferase [Enterovibrio norvegicus]